MSDGLDIWKVYRSPRDCPGQFVARRYMRRAGHLAMTADRITAPSLAELRRRLPAGLMQIPSGETERRDVLEVWI